MARHKYLTGKQLPSSKFRANVAPSNKPTDAIFRPDTVVQIVRNYLSEAQSDTIRRNFEKSVGLHKRGDDVSAQIVGSRGLYATSIPGYFRDVVEQRRHVDELFAGAEHVPSKIRDDLQAIVPVHTLVRPARHEGRLFADGRAIRFTGKGNHAVGCHDDLAQLADPSLRGLEVFGAPRPLAFNVYPSVTTCGGELVVWNIAPDVRAKRRLGIEFTGHPYPSELLADVDQIVIKPEPGDLVILSGEFVHAVNAVRGDGVRILLNVFGAFAAPSTFVTWS